MADDIIIGAGIAGITAARVLAEQYDRRVLLIEKRGHIGGNCYDEPDEYGILVHRYGPHIFHTKHEKVWTFLSRFTEWREYSHKVAARVGDAFLPVPFNLNTLRMTFPAEKADEIENQLVRRFGCGARVTIHQLYDTENPAIREAAAFIYRNIFLYYTQKQWGCTPEQIPPEVTGRVPVVISHDDRYFGDPYQAIPLHGYTAMFRKMLDHPNITVEVGTNALERLTVTDGTLFWNGGRFDGNVIYTGQTDELFGFRYGPLPYRSLRLEFEHYPVPSYQPYGVVNYTVSEDYTRITEFSHLTGQKDTDGTTILKEYPAPYRRDEGMIPYYVVSTDESRERYTAYRKLTDACPNLHLLGRLAEYAYYNMDEAVLRAMQLTENLR